jgi:uncharacterized protein YabN with tetrapyrrole methylase and pyrophosphatase domain
LLTVAGTGYNVAGHVTAETRAAMEGADRLFYLMTDSAAAAWIHELRPDAVSLHDCYREGEPGIDASNRMAERIVAPLGEGERVCALFSGHPAIGMHTVHEAIRRARERGHRTRILPAVSFEDCLVADLGVDPGRLGRALYEATDFVLRPRPVDTGTALVLIQVGAIGERRYRSGREARREGVRLLCETLSRHYPPDHEVVLYEASQLPVAEPRIARLPLRELADAPVRVAATLYVPPVAPPAKDPAVLARLGLTSPAPAR